MKLDFTLPLERATWPAIVATDAGSIQWANDAALALFGSAAERQIVSSYVQEECGYILTGPAERQKTPASDQS